MLPGQIRYRLAGLEREDGEVSGTGLVGDDFREPPRGRLLGIPFGGIDHVAGGPAEQVHPRVRRGVRPGLRRVPLPGGRDRLAERVEMLLLHAEFAVARPSPDR